MTTVSTNHFVRSGKTDPVQFKGVFTQVSFCLQKRAFCKQFSPLRYRIFISLEKGKLVFQRHSPKPHLNRTRSVFALPIVVTSEAGMLGAEKPIILRTATSILVASGDQCIRILRSMHAFRSKHASSPPDRECFQARRRNTNRSRWPPPVQGSCRMCALGCCRVVLTSGRATKGRVSGSLIVVLPRFRCHHSLLL